jgi:hypothetical protein
VINDYFNEVNLSDDQKTELTEQTVKDLILLEKGDIITD